MLTRELSITVRIFLAFIAMVKNIVYEPVDGVFLMLDDTGEPEVLPVTELGIFATIAHLASEATREVIGFSNSQEQNDVRGHIEFGLRESVTNHRHLNS